MMRTVLPLLLLLLFVLLLSRLVFRGRHVVRRTRMVDPSRVGATRHAPPVAASFPARPEGEPGKTFQQPPVTPISRVDLTPNHGGGGQLLSKQQLEFMAQRTTLLELHDVRDLRRGRIGRATNGSEVKLLDRTVREPRSIRSFEYLVARRDELEQRIKSADPRITTCWPTKLIRNLEGGIDAYHRVPLHKKFWLVDAGTEIPRNLNLAVDLRGALGGKEMSSRQASEVVRLTAKWLHVMHESGLVHGEVAFHNIAYSADPDTSISVLDFEASRKIGMPSFRGPDLSETDWLDSQATPGETSQDSDRYQLALLAFRLLVTRTRNGRIDAGAVPQVLDGFSERQTSLLRGLWDRARGPRGSRPNTHEWLYALGANELSPAS